MTPPPDRAAEMVDWDLAVRIASRLAGEGPQVSRRQADEAVTELRAGAERSTGLVREFTGLVAADHTAPVLVVDRPLGDRVDEQPEDQAQDQHEAGEQPTAA